MTKAEKTIAEFIENGWSDVLSFSVNFVDEVGFFNQSNEENQDEYTQLFFNAINSLTPSFKIKLYNDWILFDADEVREQLEKIHFEYIDSIYGWNSTYVAFKRSLLQPTNHE